MSSFFRKAISLFVILDEEGTDKKKPQAAQKTPAKAPKQQPVAKKVSSATPPPAMSQADLSKFEKHFAQLFEQTNLPGPDYYEFWKTMDTLEAHIPDEMARINAVFASLKIQGLSKKILVESAAVYEEAILRDKANFESAVRKKSDAEIAGRKKTIQQLEKEGKEKQELIKKMQKEITDSTKKAETLKKEIAKEKGKIEMAQRGYLAACNGMVQKIRSDIERFQQIIE